MCALHVPSKRCVHAAVLTAGVLCCCFSAAVFCCCFLLLLLFVAASYASWIAHAHTRTRMRTYTPTTHTHTHAHPCFSVSESVKRHVMRRFFPPIVGTALTCTSPLAASAAGRVMLRVIPLLPSPMPSLWLVRILDCCQRLLSWADADNTRHSAATASSAMAMSPSAAAVRRDADSTRTGSSRRVIRSGASHHRRAVDAAVANALSEEGTARRTGAVLLHALATTDDMCRRIASSSCVSPLLAMLRRGEDEASSAVTVVARLACIAELAWLVQVDEVLNLAADSPIRVALTRAMATASSGDTGNVFEAEELRMKQARYDTLVSFLARFDSQCVTAAACWMLHMWCFAVVWCTLRANP